MRIIILCLSFLPIFSSFAASDDSPFPLVVGNTWVYLHEHWVTPDETVTATDTLTIAVADTIQKDGKTYYILSADPFFFPDLKPGYYRVEGKTVYRYFDEYNYGERIVYDTYACGEGPGTCYVSGSKTIYEYHNSWHWYYRYQSTRYLPIGVYDGYDYSLVSSGQFSEAFGRFIVPGIGFAFYSNTTDIDYNPRGDRYSLIRATIDGHDVIAGVQAKAETPATFTLSPNHPNPFNPVTTIHYSLPASSPVTISIFNALGQQVQTHNFGIQEPGSHEFVFDGSGLPSGMYFYRVTAGEQWKVGKMVIMR
jgi:hypothetical protein